DALALFHQQCPQCRTRIIPGLSMDLVNQVDAGEIDLAAIIRPPFSLHSDLRWTTLTREPYCLIVPADVRGDDWSALISNQPFIRYDRSSFGGRQVDRFLRQTHVALREVCELDELDAIVKLVANGVGVALVPQTAALQAWPAGVRAVDLGQHTFHRDIGLVHRARRSLAEPVKELARLLTAQGQEVQ
ncbi:LysR family transcriptional regulator, partial [Pseudomonas coronafaciens]